MKKLALLLFCSFLLLSCQSLSQNSQELLNLVLSGKRYSVADGLKEALAKGTGRAVGELARKGGYTNNELYRIAAPEKLQTLTRTLRRVGLGSQVDIFENKMNAAAEEACRKAGPVFIDAIKQMTLDDATKILMGEDNAATEYFRLKTTAHLKKQYLPILQAKMSEIGLVNHYHGLIDTYNRIPFTKPLKFSLENYIADQALKGLFGYLEETEKDIRVNPAARTSELLKKVFAKQDAK